MSGTWTATSELDPRWNGSGQTTEDSSVADAVKAHLKPLLKKFKGNLPSDFRIGLVLDPSDEEEN